MEENKQKQNEVSILEIIRLLFRKIKWLILAVILGVALGGAWGYFRTTDVKVYGTEMQFYINPSKDKGSSVNSDSQYGVYGAYGKNVMNNMVELLSSQAFAETLLLDDDGLPTEDRLTAINNKDLNALVDEARTAIQTLEDSSKQMKEVLSSLTKANDEYSKAQTELELLWADALVLNPSLGEKPTENPNISDSSLKNEINTAIRKVNEANVASLRLQREYDALNKNNANLEEDANVKTEKALELWRTKDGTYAGKLNRIVRSVSYSYYDETADVEADDLARSFIYVRISVTEDYNYASWLRTQLIDEVPEYIEDKMPVPSGYKGTNCIRISRTDGVYRTNSDIAKPTAIKKGLLFGAAFFVIACVIVIFVDRSDKRLRSIEQITDIFNVPVLGVIPTFKDSERAKTTDEKTEENKKNETEVQA